MSINDLLIWMSAHERGSWSRFRSAVEQFHVQPNETGENSENADDTTASDLPVYQEVRFGLQRLGHVEFFSKSAEADWHVVPPALATYTHDDEWIGFLCGARSPELLDKLSHLNGAFSCERQRVSGMPDRILLKATEREILTQTAKDAGLAVQIDAPASILAAIPPVDDPRSRFPSEPPGGPGWIIERFSVSKLGWEGAASGDLVRAGTGLFRFRMKYQRFHFLQWRGRTFSVQVQVGKYAVLRHRRVRNLLQYNRERALLSVPVGCRPPLLIERALILCTGLLPHVEKASGRLEYTGVPLRIARLGAGLLRQEIQIR